MGNVKNIDELYYFISEDDLSLSVSRSLDPDVLTLRSSRADCCSSFSPRALERALRLVPRNSPFDGLPRIRRSSRGSSRRGIEYRRIDKVKGERRMQPGVTVALATVWLVVYVGVVGAATLHRTHLTFDQYSPLPPEHHGVYGEVGGQPDWKDQDLVERRPFDLSIGAQESIRRNVSPRRSLEARDPGSDFIHPRKEIVSSERDPPSLGGDKRSPSFVDSWVRNGDLVERGTKEPELFSREIPPSDVDEPFVADDTFQDQGPGSLEIYKLDLFKERSLLNPATVRPASRSKSKAPKKTSRAGWKSKTVDYKTTSPKVHHRQSNFFEESRTEPAVNGDTFGVGGVPELQVGCEGLEATSHKLRRSIDSPAKELDPWTDVTPISLDMDYEENYEEMDELLKLKKMETTPKSTRQSRGDMDATLHQEDFSPKRSDKLPVRGDLGKTNLNNRSSSSSFSTKTSLETKDEKSSTSSGSLLGRKLLWLEKEEEEKEMEEGETRKRRSTTWGFGEDEGVVTSDELQTENERRRQEYERRRQQGEARRREGHEGRNRTNMEIEEIKEQYRKMLEQREREEEERRRRLQEDASRRNSPSRWEEEERRREELRRRQQEEYERRASESSKGESAAEAREKRLREEEMRRRHRLQEEGRRRHDNEVSYDPRAGVPTNEEERRRRPQDEETRGRTEPLYRPSESQDPRGYEHRAREEERRRQKLEEARRRQEEEEETRRRMREEQARRAEREKWQEEMRRREQEEARRRTSPEYRQPNEDRRSLEERRREWMSKRLLEEEAERRRHEENLKNPPANLVRSGGIYNATKQHDFEVDRRQREREEREREEKLRDYVQRNRPIEVTDRGNGTNTSRTPFQERRRYRPDEDAALDSYRRAEEERRKLQERKMEEERRREQEERRRTNDERRRTEEEERKLQEYVRRNQPVRVARPDEATGRDWLENRRRIEEARGRYDGYVRQDTGRRQHGPSAQTNVDSRSHAADARRREEERLMRERQRVQEEEVRREAARRQEEMRREAARREEEVRRMQSKRYEEERQRLEAARLADERRMKEMMEEQRRKGQVHRSRPTYEHRRRLEEHRRNQDTRLVPSSLILDENRRSAERQRQEQERRRLEAERRRLEERRMTNSRHNEDHSRGINKHWERQEAVRLNSLPVSARIILRPKVSLPSNIPVLSRAGFENEVDFPDINPNRNGLQAARFPAPATTRPPVKGPGACVWAVVQCCPGSNNRLVTCFESMGCPGISWDPNPCRGSIAAAARSEVMKFYAAVDEQDDY
ncbi:hypothetical protein KM043_013230 [Ampulex compressa]|nr:hypothetical protein KM043_013230 [Ampulex compressa]